MNILVFEDTMIDQDKAIVKMPITTLFDILKVTGYVSSTKEIQYELHTEHFYKFIKSYGHDIDDCKEFHQEV